MSRLGGCFRDEPDDRIAGNGIAAPPISAAEIEADRRARGEVCVAAVEWRNARVACLRTDGRLMPADYDRLARAEAALYRATAVLLGDK